MTNPKICPSCGNSYDPSSLFCPLDSTPLRSASGPGELIGSVVAGRYLVASRIGVGGMGEVYRAQDVRLQRPVALKVLHASLAGDFDALARFSREAANCSKINNQHVVQVFDFGETDDGLAYLTMELVNGRSLKAIINSEAPLPLERVTRIVSQIASGLDAAHRLNCPVVHRDLKPENVLVTQDHDGTEIIKVADFGISKAIRDDTQRVTKTGFVTGTYEFMSPEQVTGGPVDQRSDVYSLGLITFLLLTGKLPFPAQSPEHSMLLRLSESPKSLSEMRPEIRWPDLIQRVLDKALAREPDQRYLSAGEFAKELARSLEREEQRVLSRGGPRGKGVWATAAVLMLLVALAGTLVVYPRWFSSDQETAGLGSRVEPQLVLNDSGWSGGGDLVVGDTGTQGVTPVDRDTLKPPPQVVVTVPESAESATPPAPATTPTKAEAQKPRLQRSPSGSSRRNPSLLERYDTILYPGIPPDSALLALRELNALIPRLRTARDSVEADLYRAEANALAGRSPEACAILDRARGRATERQRIKIDLWFDQGICTGSEWPSS